MTSHSTHEYSFFLHTEGTVDGCRGAHRTTGGMVSSPFLRLLSM